MTPPRQFDDQARSSTLGGDVARTFATTPIVPEIPEAGDVTSVEQMSSRDGARLSAPVHEPPSRLFEEQIEKSPSDEPRQDAQGRDTYTLSVEQIMQRLDVEGVSKSKRTVQKYLKCGEIEGELVAMAHGKKWLANELDLARFIEELKRKEALALFTQPDRDAFASPVRPEQVAEPMRGNVNAGSAVLEERVEQLQERLTSSQSEITYLRDQVQAANDHVRLWSDRASELKDLLEAQTKNNQPVLAAFAASLEAQARRSEREGAQGHGAAQIETR